MLGKQWLARNFSRPCGNAVSRLACPTLYTLASVRTFSIRRSILPSMTFNATLRHLSLHVGCCNWCTNILFGFVDHLWPRTCHCFSLLAAGDQGSGGEDDEDFHTQLDQGASGNATQHAAEFVVRQHMWFLSKCALAQAILLLYSTEQRPDDAVSKHCAMKQAYGIKRLVWALDLPRRFIRVFGAVHPPDTSISLAVYRSCCIFVCIAICTDKVAQVGRLVAKTSSGTSRWPRLQEVKDIYVATQRLHSTERWCSVAACSDICTLVYLS